MGRDEATGQQDMNYLKLIIDMGRTKIVDAGNDLIDDLDQQLNNNEQFEPMVGDIGELYLRPLEEVKDSVYLRIRTQVLKHVKTRHI